MFPGPRVFAPVMPEMLVQLHVLRGLQARVVSPVSSPLGVGRLHAGSTDQLVSQRRQIRRHGPPIVLHLSDIRGRA
jgi:hypothetical protein